MNIILLTPLSANGGIASWSKKFIKTFPSEYFNIIPIDRATERSNRNVKSLFDRLYCGLKELIHVRSEVKKIMSQQHVDVLHTTTSGSFGTLRDLYVANTTHNDSVKNLHHNDSVKFILHCRYGCISEDLKKPLFSKLLLKTFESFDQVWVLDKRSESTLNSYPSLKGKVYLTPNSINVENDIEIKPKTYKHVAFVGNLVRSKGLIELVKAVLAVKHDIKLSIVGKGPEDITTEIKSLAGDEYGERITMLGQLPNDEAVKFMDTVDVVALPTYMPSEAFPISILEAMSLGKLVLSTHRAAIGDMLTGLDGQPCGIFVEERSVEDITKGLSWAIENPSEADALCKKGYEKVYQCYRTEVVYELYRSLYRKATSSS